MSEPVFVNDLGSVQEADEILEKARESIT